MRRCRDTAAEAMLMPGAKRVAASFALRQILVNQLYGVSPGDRLTMVAVSGLLMLVAAAASAVSAIRAHRVDPIAALRQT